MKTGQNPCGVFIQALGMGQKEMQDTVEHIHRANYSTVSIMDSFELCQRTKDRVPDCDVVFRDSKFEPEPVADNKKRIADWIKTLPNDPRIRLMVNCENGFSRERIKMAMDHIDEANHAGRLLCVLNTGAGIVRAGQLKGDGTHEINEWLTIAGPLLLKLAENPKQGLGYHNYTSVFAWVVSNATYEFQKHDKRPVIDWKLAQWHMGRDLQGITAACDELDIGLPLMFGTECWVDQMNDIQNNPDNPYSRYKSNRWRNLIEPWKILYPGQDAEDILADHFYWIWDEIFAKYGRGRVAGLHFYTWLSSALSNNEWAGDNVANAPTFLARQEKYRPALPSTEPTEPPEEPEEPPTDPQILLDMQAQLDIIDQNVTQLLTSQKAIAAASNKTRALLVQLSKPVSQEKTDE